jgi:hypothetical protein
VIQEAEHLLRSIGPVFKARISKLRKERKKDGKTEKEGKKERKRGKRERKL